MAAEKTKAEAEEELPFSHFLSLTVYPLAHLVHAVALYSLQLSTLVTQAFLSVEAACVVAHVLQVVAVSYSLQLVIDPAHDFLSVETVNPSLHSVHKPSSPVLSVAHPSTYFTQPVLSALILYPVAQVAHFIASASLVVQLSIEHNLVVASKVYPALQVPHLAGSAPPSAVAQFLATQAPVVNKDQALQAVHYPLLGSTVPKVVQLFALQTSLVPSLVYPALH